MILVITHKRDFTADFVIDRLNERGISYKRMNCEDILTDGYSFRFDDAFNYSILNESNYTSVWFRRTKFPELAPDTQNELYLLNEFDSLFKNLFAVVPAMWLSNPFAVSKAENKLFQLSIATRLGFTIPPTLVTNSKEELNGFFELHRNIIVKPLSQARINDKTGASLIFTNEVTQEQINNIGDFDLTPCIFQKNISKKMEVRVTVVGDKVFSAEVDSQSNEGTLTDWRKEKIKFMECQIPDKISDLCVSLVKTLGLRFGAIDLIHEPNGNYTFLEINPNGQWVWIENDTGLEISSAIINELQGYA